LTPLKRFQKERGWSPLVTALKPRCE
jgi:hypothetical protein